MQQATKRRIARVIAPFFLAIGFLFKTVYKLLFAWWLDCWIHEKATNALLGEVRAHLGFLFTDYGAELVDGGQEGRSTGFATITLHVLSFRLRFSDMQGDLHVEVAPDKLPQRYEELSSVLAWWDIKDGVQCRRSYATWRDLEAVLRSELGRINTRLADEP